MADSGTNPVRPNTFELEADVNVEFNEAASRQQINSGESVKTLFGKLRKFLTDLKAVAFSGSYDDLSNTPDLTQYATKAELDTKAEKKLYGNNGLNLGRLAGSTVGFLSSTMGRANAATGGYSFSQGFDNTASGVASFAGGQSSAAEGENALAHGYFVKTTKNNEKAFGAYNKSSSDTLFSIGDGTSDSARHNAFEITTTGGKLHDKDIATTDLISTELPANGGNADTLSSKSIDYFMHWRNETIVNPDTCEAIGIYQWATPTTITINPIAYGTLIVSNAFGFKCQIVIGVDTSVFVRHKTYDQEWSAWRNVSDGGNADTVDGLHASDFYSIGNKPYVTGTLSEQASSTSTTMSFTIFNFTPSKVLCQFGNGNAFFANVVTNGFSVTIPAGTTTIHYIAFK